MDHSSVIVNQEIAGIVDSMNVNGCLSPNALPVGINGDGNAADGSSSDRLSIDDRSDDSFSGSKRKFESKSDNGNSSEEDDHYVPIEKLRKLDIPILVEPIRSVKASEICFSPGSVKVENLTPLDAVPISIRPMENLEDDIEIIAPIKSCRQFWKAGDYEGNCTNDPISSSGNYRCR